MKKTKQNQTWFLETSVHINRFFGHHSLKKKIEETIIKSKLYTSAFVFYEFKRRVVETLINLYYLVQEEETLADALSNYAQNYNIRGIKIVLEAVSFLLSRDDLKNNKQKSLASIKLLIIHSRQSFQESIAGFVENQIKCPLAEASIDESYEKFLEQIKCKANCTASLFWQEHRKILESLIRGESLERHRKNIGFIKMLEPFREVLEDCKRGQGIRNCKKLADAIIAIEMPKKHTMLTFDRSFESLCPLMGKKVKRLPSLIALKRQLSDS